MMFTTPMAQLFAVVLQKDSQRVTEALLREGVMQFISTSEMGDVELRAGTVARPRVSLTEITELRRRAEGLLHTVDVTPSAPSETDLDNRVTIDMQKETVRLDGIESKRAGVRERQRAIQQEILKLEDIQRQVALYGPDLPDVARSTRHSFISVQIGKLPAANVKRFEDALKGLPSLPVEMGREADAN